MTREKNRVENLKRLIREFKTAAALSETSGISEKYISQIITGARLPSGNTRSLGNRAARKLEEAAGKPVGWMDLDHKSAGVTPDFPCAQTIDEIELLRLYKAASATKRRAIMTIARLKTLD